VHELVASQTWFSEGIRNTKFYIQIVGVSCYIMNHSNLYSCPDVVARLAEKLRRCKDPALHKIGLWTVSTRIGRRIRCKVILASFYVNCKDIYDTALSARYDLLRSLYKMIDIKKAVICFRSTGQRFPRVGHWPYSEERSRRRARVASCEK
jgi:hypothetical protein